MDKRLNTLTRWVERVLGRSGFDLSVASSDASFRRYFRVRADGASYIVMDAPPAKEDVRPYIHTAQRFLDIGLNVPEILSTDLEQGFLMLSDLGSQTYLQSLTPESVERLYGDALGALIVLQTGTYTDPDGFPRYHDDLLTQEMELFRQWYLGRYLDRVLSNSEHRIVDHAFTMLCQNARAQPQVWVHRDYHSRNLMVTKTNNPGILDFQDAVVGPITYDLVSLLRDCYICWPQPRVEEWALGYYHLALQSGLPIGYDEKRFLRDFDWMGVQRHLKVLGIFSRLYYRDGKSAFLEDLPTVHRYLVDVCAAYPELYPLRSLLLKCAPPDG